jgi:hypothetical protein
MTAIIVDTSAVSASLDEAYAEHEAIAAIVSGTDGLLVVSPLVGTFGGSGRCGERTTSRCCLTTCELSGRLPQANDGGNPGKPISQICFCPGRAVRSPRPYMMALLSTQGLPGAAIASFRWSGGIGCATARPSPIQVTAASAQHNPAIVGRCTPSQGCSGPRS